MKAEEYYNEFFPPKMQSETPEFENLSIFSKRDMIKFADAFGKIKAKAELKEAAERIIEEQRKNEDLAHGFNNGYNHIKFIQRATGFKYAAKIVQSITENPLD